MRMFGIGLTIVVAAALLAQGAAYAADPSSEDSKGLWQINADAKSKKSGKTKSTGGLKAKPGGKREGKNAPGSQSPTKYWWRFRTNN